MNNEFKRENIPALDGIRGLAILLVIVSHTNALNLSGQGSIGVWIFFVLSGFLLAQPFVAKIELINLKYFSNFYIRRLKRIVPMYYIIVATFVIFLPSFIGNEKSIFKHLIFTQANGHLWSTQQEMLFYLICPIIFYINYMLIKNLKFSNLIISIFILIESLLLNTFLTTDIFYLNGNGKQAVFYISVFLIGIAISYFSESNLLRNIKDNKYIKCSLNYVSVLILLVFIFSAKYYKELIGIFPTVDYLGWTYPVFFAILAGILILTVTINQGGIISRIFNVVVLRSCGKVSYSMYLIHYFLLQFIGRYITGNILFLVLLPITYVISIFTYNYIEQKFLRLELRYKN